MTDYPTHCKNCGSGGLIKKGYCDKCYRRMLHHGHLEETRRPRGAGHISSKGYKVHTKFGERVYEHHLIARPKAGEVVHHKDGNRLNNHPDNLQVMTRSEHMKEHWKERKGS
jgi:hypothetical protein